MKLAQTSTVQIAVDLLKSVSQSLSGIKSLEKQKDDALAAGPSSSGGIGDLLQSQKSIKQMSTLEEVPGLLGRGDTYKSMNVEDLLQGLWAEGSLPKARAAAAKLPKDIRAKSVQDAWAAVVSSSSGGSGNREEPTPPLEGTLTVKDYIGKLVASHKQQAPAWNVSVDIRAVQRAARDRKRGNPAAKALEPKDSDATEKKKRRMVKNRESAARSREKKQALLDTLRAENAELKAENARLKAMLEITQGGEGGGEEDAQK